MWLLLPLPRLTNSRHHRCSCIQQGWTLRGNMLHPNPSARQSVLRHEEHCLHQRWQLSNVLTCGSRAVFVPPHEAPCETLQACFLLKLEPPMPVMLPLFTKIQKLTGGKEFSLIHLIFIKLIKKDKMFCLWFIDVTISEVHQQMAPLPKLLLHKSASVKGHEEEMDERDAYSTVVFISHSIFSWLLYCFAHNVKLMV